MKPKGSAPQQETTEERLVRLSVLQELTVGALDLFDPLVPVDDFLERVAERLGCLAVLWLTLSPNSDIRLLGAAGISEASRALPIAKQPAAGDALAGLVVPYPELSRERVAPWHFQIHPSIQGSAQRGHALLLWFDAAHIPSAQYQGAMERLVGVLRTVLSHRRLAEDLRHSYAQLERTQLALVERERLAATGELAAVVAHEVRNPLAVIFNCVSSLQKRNTSADEGTSALISILSEEAEHLNQIVSELLDFSRPDEVNLRSESMEEVLRSAIFAVENAQAAPSKIQISLQVQARIPAVLVDERLIRRAVINLIGNAVQATPAGGRVDVRLRTEIQEGRGWLCIEVCDCGDGIPSEIRERIFDPFFTTKASGTGLGLSIVRRAADAHEGKVSVSSEPGEGTTFVLRIPCAAA